MSFTRGFILSVVMGFMIAPGLLRAQDTTNTGPDVHKFLIRNLGPVVNTANLEYAPTVTADGKTLFFVSDRPG